jgi:hypothetical protein
MVDGNDSDPQGGRSNLVWCDPNNLVIMFQACQASCMARPVSVLELTPGEKQELRRLASSKTLSQRDGLRARIVLRRAAL